MFLVVDPLCINCIDLLNIINRYSGCDIYDSEGSCNLSSY